TPFPSTNRAEDEKVPLVRKSKEKPAFDSVLDEDDFDADVNSLRISESPFQKQSAKSKADSDSGFDVAVDVGKTKEISGIPVACLGLSGFGRGKRKPKN
ncbi:hypothetical protein Anas_10717, partial [Armadillidium nasatum]